MRASPSAHPAFHAIVRAAAIAAAIAAMATLLAGGAAAADAVTVRDASGQSVTVTDPSRIVSVGGAITEILYALGLQERIVAVDTTSLYPAEALKEKPNVGYMRQLSPEGVLGLAPSLILAADGSGPKEAVAVLTAATVPFVRIPDQFTGESIIEKVRMVAAAAGAKARGECLVGQVAADLDAVAALRARITQPVRVMFVMSFLNGRPMIAGRNTGADGIIRLAGGINAMTEFEGYRPVNDEAVIAARPDMVLVMQRSHDQLDAQAVFAHAAFALTPAAAQQAFVAMDGLYLLGFGPRTARAARDLAARLYPALQPGALPSERAGAGCGA